MLLLMALSSGSTSASLRTASPSASSTVAAGPLSASVSCMGTRCTRSGEASTMGASSATETGEAARSPPPSVCSCRRCCRRCCFPSSGIIGGMGVSPRGGSSIGFHHATWVAVLGSVPGQAPVGLGLG
jgi:hypothetical protein